MGFPTAFQRRSRKGELDSCVSKILGAAVGPGVRQMFCGPLYVVTFTHTEVSPRDLNFFFYCWLVFITRDREDAVIAGKLNAAFCSEKMQKCRDGI